MTTNVVVVAPHSDDECLGAGGAIALLAEAGANVTVITVCSELPPVFPVGERELIQQEARDAHRLLGVSQSLFFDIPTTEVNQVPVALLNGRMLEAMEAARPNMVLLPFPDRHIDHRVAFESAIVATRPYRSGADIQLVAMYETISETFWNVPGAEPSFTPHWTIDISRVVEKKIAAFTAMPSRHASYPGPRSVEALRGLATFRGSQSSFGSGESFQIVRMTMSPDQLAQAFG